MTLTLEDLKNVRFPIAKKNGEGYRAIEVDAFLDQVDDTVSTLLDENARLKAQVEGLGTVGGAGDATLRSENDKLRAQVAELQKAVDSKTTGDAGAELARLRSENSDLRGQLQQARQEAEAARQSVTTDGPVNMVVTTSAEASPAVTRLVQLATEQAESVVNDANAEANRTLEQAQAKAQQLTLDAQTRADRIQSEARVSAEQQTSAAKANADRVNQDADNRRRELFSTLENERQQLTHSIESLRSYEQNYRESLVAHHQQAIEALSKASFEPGDAPQVASITTVGDSRTPRLDALLAEGN